MLRVSALLVTIGAAFFTNSISAQDIDTSPYWCQPGCSSVSPFTAGEGRAFGQVFTVGHPNTLDSFSFWVSGNSAQFLAYVFEWDDANRVIVGPALYQSAWRTTNAQAPTMTTFQTGGLNLSSGSMYVAFLDAGGPELGTNTYGVGIISGGSTPDPYPGGYRVGSGDQTEPGQGETFSAFYTLPWNRFANDDPQGQDAVFRASFSVPEPSTSLLMLTGLLGLGIVAWQRRKQVA